jgi:hypothetical protein
MQEAYQARHQLTMGSLSNLPLDPSDCQHNGQLLVEDQVHAPAQERINYITEFWPDTRPVCCIGRAARTLG